MELLNSINDFFTRFPEARQLGKQTNLLELEKLPRVVYNNLPEFWKTALVEFPLCNLAIGIPSDFGQTQLKKLPREKLPLMSIEFLSPTEILEETINSFPGYKLFESSVFFRTKYICIATEKESTNEGIFISTKGKNPKPLLVFHDFGETKRLLIKNSKIISSSLSNLFKEAHLKNRNRVISEQQLNLVKTQIAKLHNDLKKVTLSTPDRIPETNSVTEQSILNSIIDGYSVGILNYEIGAYMESLTSLDELSIPNKKELWQQIHKLYEICDLHKGDLFFSEANSMIEK